MKFHSPSNQALTSPSLQVTQTYRYEGNTDPRDESVVFGIVCPGCGARGIVVSAYGPDADPEIFDLLTRLSR